MSDLNGLTVGGLLRSTREGADLSLREVSDVLNLPMQTVTALEADDLEQLPAPVFTRGYYRAYAKLLGLEDHPLVQTPTEVAAAEAQDNEPDAANPTLEQPSVAGKSNSAPLVIAGGLITLLLVIAGVVWFASSDDEVVQSTPPTVQPGSEIEAAAATNTITHTDSNTDSTTENNTENSLATDSEASDIQEIDAQEFAAQETVAQATSTDPHPELVEADDASAL